MRFRFARAIALALLPILASAVVAAAEPGQVNIYSYRQPYLINPLLKKFSAETGVKVNVIFAEKGLIERIQAEGHNSPADVLLTVDVGNLTQATDAGIAQPVDSPVLEAAIPPAYRAADKEWFGLTAARAWSTPPKSGSSSTRSPMRTSPTPNGTGRSASARASTFTMLR